MSFEYVCFLLVLHRWIGNIHQSEKLFMEQEKNLVKAKKKYYKIKRRITTKSWTKWNNNEKSDHIRKQLKQSNEKRIEKDVLTMVVGFPLHVTSCDWALHKHFFTFFSVLCLCVRLMHASIFFNIFFLLLCFIAKIQCQDTKKTTTTTEKVGNSLFDVRFTFCRICGIIQGCAIDLLYVSVSVSVYLYHFQTFFPFLLLCYLAGTHMFLIGSKNC